MMNRPALLQLGNLLFVAFGSVCDMYIDGWVFAYDISNPNEIKQVEPQFWVKTAT
jgi:hypothetical protein